MISKIARRLGFQQSVPVALIEDWIVPESAKAPVELAPREGAAACLVDEFARIQIPGATWSLDLTLAAGARWVPAATSERVKQRLVLPGVLETTIQTPSGPVVHRVAAGVVDSKPVAIVEVENTGGVAIAVGMVVRPIGHAGRGYIGETKVDEQGISIEGRHVVRFETSPATVAAAEGVQGDLLQSMPDAEQARDSDVAMCRSGGAQAAAVWPVPHTATLRVTVELQQATSIGAPVPSTDDVNRGWLSHLKRGLQVDLDELAIQDDLTHSARSLLTGWPDRAKSASPIIALSELGFARDAGRLFHDLEHVEDDRLVMLALARWAQLGEQTEAQLHDLDVGLVRLAKAAHAIDSGRVELSGPAWLASGLVALGGRLHDIDQPDVAERVQGLATTLAPIHGALEEFTALSSARDRRGVWADGQMSSAARQVIALRSLIVDDAGGELRLLPEMPALWRGRMIDILGLPIANGTISLGLRWHGPRPALLWEATMQADAPLRLTVPGIDPDFESTDYEGEVLLADPGWKTA